MGWWDGLHPAGVEGGWLVILRGYIDESYDVDDAKIFTLSCVLGSGKAWYWIQEDWRKCLLDLNAKLLAAGRKSISRYHAADCSALKGDFDQLDGWTIDEQKELTGELLGILTRIGRRLHTLSFSLKLDELIAEMPETASDPIANAYILLLKFILFEVSQLLAKHFPGVPVSFIHDRCRFDTQVLKAFNDFISDDAVKNRDQFLTIAPMSWEHCILLQPADLLAYESFREVKAGKQKLRKPLELLVAAKGFSGSGRTFQRQTLSLIQQES